MADPVFSVIIPCYNLGQYVDEAVRSVFAQTFQSFEIVIVNDGSTDRATNELLASYTRPHTRVITTPNRGVMAARNLAIAETTGRYISALDADDRLLPTYFEKAFHVLEADPSVAWVSSWLRVFGEEDWEWKPERCDLVTLLGEQTVCTPAPVRRSAVLAVGGYDERMPKMGFEDWEFWINVAAHGYRGVILREVLFEYRARAGSLSKKAWRGEHHLELFEFMVRKHRDTYREHLMALLRRKEAEHCELLGRHYALERRTDSWLTPIVQLRREELNRLEARLPAHHAPPPPPAAAASSWRQSRVAAPLRYVYRRWKRRQTHAAARPS